MYIVYSSLLLAFSSFIEGIFISIVMFVFYSAKLIKIIFLLLKRTLLWFLDTVLVQQVDFLETILEETSDDLQSDSDRSGTTYWVGSDSETESVIHIRAKQRLAGKK